jgi:hypothetical protein
MLSAPLLSVIALPVSPHHVTPEMSWALIGVIAANVATLITLVFLGFWGFRLGSKRQGGDGPGGGGPRKPSPRPAPPSGGLSLVGKGVPDPDVRDFSVWEAELASAVTPERRDREKAPAARRLGTLTWRSWVLPRHDFGLA